MGSSFLTRRKDDYVAFKSIVDDSLTEVTADMLNGITTITDYAFAGCQNLESVTLPGTVNTIDDYAFSNCSKLSNVVMQNGVTSIGGVAFLRCRSLTSITLPTSLDYISTAVFRECTSLNNITIPSGVTNIGSSTFYGCSSLSSVTVEATTPPSLGSGVFSSTSSSLVIYVPSGSVETYKTANNWSTYADKIQAIPSP